MNKMHVAYVLLYYPYPSETFVANEIARLRGLGVAVDVCALLPLKRWYGVDVDETPDRPSLRAQGFLSAGFWRAQAAFIASGPRKYGRLLWRSLVQGGRSPAAVAKQLVIFLRAVNLAWQLRGQGVRVVHSHFASLPSLGGLAVSRLLNVPFTLTAHAYDIFQKPDLVPLVTSHARRVVAISQVNRERLLTLCPTLEPDRIEVIHCGVDLKAFSPARLDYERPEHIRILSVGRLAPKKGHRVLLEACRRLHDFGLSFECDIVGDGPLRAELLQTVQRLGLQGHVRLRGHLPPKAVAECLRHSDIFVLPCLVDANGDRDGIPVSLMEAMATELSVVSTPVSGVPELVRHGRNGLLVNPEDPLALAAALMALARNPWLRRTLGERARQTVAAEFNAARSAAQMESVFQRVSNGRAMPGPSRASTASDPTRTAERMEQQA